MENFWKWESSVSSKGQTWYLGRSHPISSLRPKLCLKYWDFVFRTLFGWLCPQDGLIWETFLHGLSSSHRNDRFWYKKRLNWSSYAKVRAKTVCCISLPQKFWAKLPGRFRAKPKVCTRCAPKTGILTLFADLRGRFQHQDDLGWKSDQLRNFSALQDLQLCFWDHRDPKPYATYRSCARGLLDVILARKFWPL